MSTDLVTLLRKQVQMHYDKQPDGSFVRGPNIPDPLSAAAADEIERLRMQLKMRPAPTADCECGTCFIIRQVKS